MTIITPFNNFSSELPHLVKVLPIFIPHKDLDRFDRWVRTVSSTWHDSYAVFLLAGSCYTNRPVFLQPDLLGAPPGDGEAVKPHQLRVGLSRNTPHHPIILAQAHARLGLGIDRGRGGDDLAMSSQRQGRRVIERQQILLWQLEQGRPGTICQEVPRGVMSRGTYGLEPLVKTV